MTIHKIDSQTGYTIIKLDQIELPNNFETILHIIDPNEINKVIDELEETLNLLTHEYNHRKIILKEIDNIRNMVHTMLPYKQKRGLINIGGTIIKWVFGTMDNEDRQRIEEHILTIDKNNHNLIKNMNQQIKINDNFNKSFIMIQEAIKNDRQQMNLLYKLERKTFSFNLINEQLFKLNIIKEKVKQIQDNIASARLNLLHPNILSKEEIIKYNIDFKKLNQIRLGLAKHINGIIIFAIKIPIDYVILNKKVIIPINNENNTLIKEKIEYTLELNNSYYKFSSSQSFKELEKSENCIFKNNCKLITNYESKIINIDENSLIIQNAVKFEMNSNCDERQFTLNGNYFVNFFNCNINIDNKKFSNTEYHYIEKFVIPNLNKTKSEISLSFDDIVLKTKENIQEINELRYHKHINYFGITGILIILIICFVLISIKIQFIMKTQESFQTKRGGVTSLTHNDKTIKEVIEYLESGR